MTATKSMRRRFVPQERDLAILRYIKDHKTLSLDLLHRRFWPGKTFNACYFRMQDLTAWGVVKRVDMDLLRCPIYFYLTSLGLKMLIDHGLASRGHRLPVPDASDIIRSDFQHNQRVAAIRIALETDPQIRVANWVSDEQIKADPEAYRLGAGKRPELKGIRHTPRQEAKFKYRIPDGVFDFEDAEREAKIILEYEHGRYMRWKFRAYLANWEERWGEHQKLIVTATPERIETLRKWCLEDLSQRYRLELQQGREELKRLSAAYLITDYHALIRDGLTRKSVKTPDGQVSLKPFTSEAPMTPPRPTKCNRLQILPLPA